jgi:carboxymethylenebutenolidase
MATAQPKGFLARPPAGSGPAVLALHAWWGLNDFFRSFCSRLADEGFLVFAPDLFHGATAATIGEAEQLSSRARPEQAAEDVAAALEFVHGHEAARGGPAGVIGFSFGAYYAVQLSCIRPEGVRAVVLFYGIGEGDLDQARASYLGHFAENDPYEPADGVRGLEKALLEAGRPAEFHTYPGTGHWFFESDRADAYHPKAAESAWERTRTFLRRELAGG